MNVPEIFGRVGLWIGNIRLDLGLIRMLIWIQDQFFHFPITER